jgi:hypothetical protein
MFLLMMVWTSARSAVRAAMLRWLRVSWNTFLVFWMNVSAAAAATGTAAPTGQYSPLQVNCEHQCTA